MFNIISLKRRKKAQIFHWHNTGNSDSFDWEKKVLQNFLVIERDSRYFFDKLNFLSIAYILRQLPLKTAKKTKYFNT